MNRRPMTETGRLRDAMRILCEYSDYFEVTPIPESFPNGTPDYSRRAYLSVELDTPLSDEHRRELRSLGVVEECEGMYAVIYF